jgi:hypothetical protein
MQLCSTLCASLNDWDSGHDSYQRFLDTYELILETSPVLLTTYLSAPTIGRDIGIVEFRFQFSKYTIGSPNHIGNGLCLRPLTLPTVVLCALGRQSILRIPKGVLEYPVSQETRGVKIVDENCLLLHDI